VIVVGAAVYGVATGTVLPGTEDVTEEEPPAENETPTPPASEENQPDTGGGGDGSGGGVTEEDSGDGETAVGNETEEVTDTGPEPLPVVCEDQGGEISRDNVGSLPSAAEPLDQVRAESMLHDALNKVRAIHSDADPFKCDPELREIARDHSQLILIQEGARGNEQITSDYQESQERIRELGGELELDDNLEDLTRDEVEVNETRMFGGVCGENYEMGYGQFAYGINIEGGDSGDFSFDSEAASDFADDQEQTIIRDHENLVRDARRLFVDSDSVEDQIIDESMTRQGVGIATDRRTGEVVVTVIHCGPRSDQTQEQNP